MTAYQIEELTSTDRTGVFVELGVVVDMEEVDLAGANRLRRWVATRRRHCTKKRLHVEQYTTQYNTITRYLA